MMGASQPGDRAAAPRGNAQVLSGDRLLVVCTNTVVRELMRKFDLEQPS